MEYCKIQKKEITYEINKKNLTAKVIESPSAKGDIFIPLSVEYNSIDYEVTKISKNSFSKNFNIKSIKFPENSALETIEKDSFSYSSIEHIYIPSKVNELQDGWLNYTSKLTNITISPENEHFKYDDERNFIFGRSDSKSSTFDIIISANRYIRIAEIPAFIRHISSYAFSYCLSLKIIIFCENSKLETIGDNAFLCSSIIDIKIPKNVRQIKENTFSFCKFLQKVDFETNSELREIDQFAFSFSSLKKLSIPEKVEELKDDWCNYTTNLSSVSISPGNNNFKYLDENNQIIIGKSNQKNEFFDSIFFASRDIEKVVVPNTIQYIKPSSFCDCNKLKTIEFSNDSNLLSIGQNCFTHSSLEKIKIPNKVSQIEKSAFAGCINLKVVEIEKDSELKTLSTNVFSGSLIETIFIPKKVTNIGEFCFSDCRNLERIEIDQESELSTINGFTFTNSSIKTLYFPEKMEELKEEWCHCTLKLTKILISPKNNNFQYMDEKEQIIVGKSDKNNDFYDSIVFANRNIEKVIIPSKIQCIRSSSFSCCKKLKKIEFESDSNLQTICKNAFYNTSLSEIKIPKRVKDIHDYSFQSCNSLRTIEFDDDSELESINKFAFSFTFCMSICLPKSVKYLNERSFENCYELRNLEFNGNEIFINRFSFINCPKLFIISFPNASQLNIIEEVLSEISNETRFFISANAIININKK